MRPRSGRVFWEEFPLSSQTTTDLSWKTYDILAVTDGGSVGECGAD